ncbi:hypothetical protein DEA8626_01186 [Defluviimonas aquaemixtae]|uniref:DUF924 domain-containing protein n=1 Tax=Albidovulum aquaemixtae TaxID=1542388 RepID=A0A2R8B544_9RHOB|nr:DUF924 family protein [Defluviimonas aquaemixtae]SPH17662.1 hypothetical protein DEA8626_01186 [Defluviimonas aquaemixtae]
MSEPEAVVDFWLHEIGPSGWYVEAAEVDEEIRSRFGAEWAAARAGERDYWCNGPRGTLAFLILTDQFPRNMFRGTGDAFATDERAREAARKAVGKEFDLSVREPERIFFYMPFEHSEKLEDQDFAVDLVQRNMIQSRDEYLRHARAHREIIRRFGRFPFRNEALGRKMTPEETEFIEKGGYRGVLNALDDT